MAFPLADSDMFIIGLHEQWNMLFVLLGRGVQKENNRYVI